MNPFADNPAWGGYVDVTIVEFAAHTAYLDPRTGTGYLVAPRPETDVAAPEDPFVEVAWSEQLNDYCRIGGLSLHAADRQRALTQLAQEGWQLLRDELGVAERAGRTTDGRPVVCLYGETTEEPTLVALRRALMALGIAAGLDEQSSQCGTRRRPG